MTTCVLFVLCASLLLNKRAYLKDLSWEVFAGTQPGLDKLLHFIQHIVQTNLK